MSITHSEAKRLQKTRPLFHQRAVPAVFRMMYSNSSRSGTAGFFQVWQGAALMFMGHPVKLAGEHMFGEMTFYSLMLAGTFFLYQFFPELVLNDFIFALFTALFILPVVSDGGVWDRI